MSSRQHKALRKEARAHVLAPQPARSRARWLLPLLALTLLAGGALLWWTRSSASETIVKRALVVPDPPIGELEPPVQEILGKARQNLLANLGSANAWGWYAAVLDAHQLYAEAETCYRRAHELDPLDVRHSYDLALLLETLGAEPDRSLELYRLVAQKEPKFPPVHVHIAHNLSRKGELDAAAAAYQKALELDPQLWIARRALGRVWIELEQPARAVGELERVASAVPNDGPTQAALAQAYASQGELVRAASATERAREFGDMLSLPDPMQFQVRMQGRSARLASERAMARGAEGDYAGVVEDLKLVLCTRASDAKVHERLADAYQRLGKHGLAEQELAEARRLRGSK